MESLIYRYRFSNSVSIDAVEESLLLATLSTESSFGRSRVQMDSCFRLDKKNRVCSIDASTPVGSNIATVFTGFLAREFGESTFTVERVEKLE
jgi:hypothetical protein